jgi:hypothetical protein
MAGSLCVQSFGAWTNIFEAFYGINEKAEGRDKT